MKLKLYLGGLWEAELRRDVRFNCLLSSVERENFSIPRKFCEIKNREEALEKRAEFIQELARAGTLVSQGNGEYVFQYGRFRESCSVLMEIDGQDWRPTKTYYKVFVQFEGQKLRLIHMGESYREQQDQYDYYRNHPDVLYSCCKTETISLPLA